MAETSVHKSHPVLMFFLGFFTGILVLAGLAALTLDVLYRAYEPQARSLIEDAMEQSLSRTASSSIGLNIEIDLKAVSYASESNDATLSLYGLADVAAPVNKTKAPVVINATISQENYAKLSENVPSSGDKTKDLKDNYSAKSLIYLALAGQDSTTTFKNLTLDGTLYDWSKISVPSLSL